METSAHWTDDDLVLISSIEHWSYCPRQCALIHLEATFEENIYTLRGRHVHERAHSETVATEDGLRVSRGMPVWSDVYGLTGKADIIEWHGDTPYPVEYKLGKIRNWQHEALQLCAQAMCLAEMFETEVERGAVYYVGSRRRREIVFSEELIALVVETAAAIRDMFACDRMPPAPDDVRCRDCVVVDACQPRLIAHPAILRGHYGELFNPTDLAEG